MSGKRRDYDGNFAVVDINFILDDPRLDELTSADRWLYITLWCLSVRERRETLPAHYGNKSVARLSRLDTRTVQNGLTKLQHNCLISINEKCEITVTGIKNKHKNLKWKVGDINENIAPQIPPIRNKEKEISKNNKEKRPSEIFGGCFYSLREIQAKEYDRYFKNADMEIYEIACRRLLHGYTDEKEKTGKFITVSIQTIATECRKIAEGRKRKSEESEEKK